MSRYVAESVTMIAGRFGHVGLCQLRTKLKKRPAIIVIDSATYLLTISSPDFRSTPVEVLHTVFLGPYKYLTGKVMAKLSAVQKCEIMAGIASVDYSGIEERISSNITQYSQSFVGRDF